MLPSDALGASAQAAPGGFENPPPNGNDVIDNNNGVGNGVGTVPDTVQPSAPNEAIGAVPNTETSPVPSNGVGGGATTQQQRGVVNCRNNICYSMAIPQRTSSTGQGNIFFQIYAPDTFSWVGMGTGSSMSDSNMFVVYQDGAGNVTVSPRQADGHTMPTVPTTNAPMIELLEGSGVANGVMTANFRCVNCDSWKGNQLNFASTDESMIGAWQTGDPLNSIDINERIGKHTGNVRSFSFDTTQAQVTNDVNPFVGANAVPAEVNENTNENNNGNGNGENAGTGSSGLLKQGLGLGVILAALPLLGMCAIWP